MTQQLLDFDRPIPPRDPHIDPRDVPRVSRQCRLILERLRQGPATNAELVGIAMNLTGRISDLRGAGYVIVGKRIEGGLWEYRLKNQS
jgi:hypothetical protein